MSDVDSQIGRRIRALRGAMTLDALARQAGVSRAMLSRVERDESSPTAQFLARLAMGLGVSLSTLFAEAAASPLARAEAQPLWRDPASGYLRRAISPAGTGSSVDIVEIIFPPLARVGFDNRRDIGLDQHVWVLEGRLELTLDGALHAMGPGDCLHMRLDRPVEFHNPTPTPTRYVVIIGGRS
jgi:transcriptional regulator with XRE-family HTH domain